MTFKKGGMFVGEAKRRKELGLEGRKEDQIGELTTIERDQILEIVRQIPPLAWLIDCQTEDQADHWQDMSGEYAKLGAAFGAFFGGECPDDLYQSSKKRELFENWAQCYLALYQVLRYSWRSIKQRLEEWDLPMSQKPGELVQLLILLECSDTFQTCQRFGEYPQRKTYDLLGRINQIECQYGGEIARKRAYTAILKDFKSRGLDWATMPALTIELLRIAQRHSKRDRLTRQAMEDYFRTTDRESALLKRNVPPSHSWDGRGNQKMGKEHGRYASP